MNLKELLQYCKDNAADAHTKTNQTAEPAPSPDPAGTDHVESTSANRAATNRANAQHSTGPKSSSGKGRSALNAVKTALTGRTVLLESDDVDLYNQHVAGWFAELKPEGLHETTLVQSIADSHWRNDRIVTIEAAIFARGRINYRWENVNCYEDEAAGPTEITVLTDVQLNTIYERELRNLHIQENRLRRQRENDLKLLWQLQTARLQAAAETEANAQAQPKSKAEKAITTVASAKPKRSGFVFSNRTPMPATATQRRTITRSQERKRRQKNNRKAA